MLYRVVFYKSLILKTPKNKFYPTFQFAIFLNTISKQPNISFLQEVLQIQPNHCFYLSAISCLQVEGTTTSLSISSFLDSWGEDKLESKSESYSSMTSSYSFSMISSYIGRFIAHTGWHGQCASWKLCCLLRNTKLSNTLPMFTCPFPHLCNVRLVWSMCTTGIGFNFV